MLRYLVAFTLVVVVNYLPAQVRRPILNACQLADSVDNKLIFIKMNAARIFTDTADCKDNLLDTLAEKYVQTKDSRYLEVLTAIRQNPNAKAEGLFTDVINLFLKDDFTGFVAVLYKSKGKLLPLQNEMIASLNMIVNGRPVKQRFMQQLETEIERVKNGGDQQYASYLDKLRQKIETEQYR